MLHLLNDETRLEDTEQRIGPQYMNIAQVAQRIGLEEGTVAEIADELKAEGLIEYMPLGSTACVITAHGRQALRIASRLDRTEIS